MKHDFLPINAEPNISNKIFEKWNTKFDIIKLQKHLEEFAFPLEPVYQSASFGGWSVLSADGSYKDGWQQGHKQLKSNMTKEEISIGIKRAGLRPIWEYVKPTEICHGYLKEVIDFFIEKGLSPFRARIMQLTPGLSSTWHRDASDNAYGVRLHVPIFTNSECFFEIEEDRAHLPSDGSSYFLKVNRIHRVINGGETFRYHLVMDVKDRLNISNHHRFIQITNTI